MGVVLPQPIQFGKYTLFERIGRGGMADVFKGRVQGPAGFERVFVVKRILPHLSDDPQFTKMFIEEAKLSARLNHPNIVQVFELGNVEHEYFIAMEYVKGRDLSETMRTLWARIGPPRPELVAYIGREMCRALAYAHDLTSDDGTPLGMIHRDVSPSNVMLSYDGAVKLLDFGIAKALGGDSKEDTGTGRGTLKGKFAYMAPEQTQGSDVDSRIDVFAAGIVLHEVLTGRRLFKGENDLQTVERVRQCEVPPPSATNPLCPPELDEILYRALARNRDERFQTAAEMADALDDVVHAARFQPTHLAQLMRDLFPSDVAGGTSQTSARITSASLSAVSRPHSAGRSTSGFQPISRTGSQSPVRTPPFANDPPPFVVPAPTPFYRKGGFWVAGALLLGVAFGGGVVYTQQGGSKTVVASGEERTGEPRTYKTSFTTFPDGVRIYEHGTNRYLGTSPGSFDVEFKDGVKAVLLFRKEHFEDMEREIRAQTTVVVTMRKNPTAGEKTKGKDGTKEPGAKEAAAKDGVKEAAKEPAPAKEPPKEKEKDAPKETRPSSAESERRASEERARRRAERETASAASPVEPARTEPPPLPASSAAKPTAAPAAPAARPSAPSHPRSEPAGSANALIDPYARSR